MREGWTNENIKQKWWIVPRGQHSIVEYAKEIDPNLVRFESAEVGSWFADFQGIVHKVAGKSQDMLMIEHHISNEIPPAKTWFFKNENQTTHLMQAYNGEVLLIDTLNKDNTRTILAKQHGKVFKTTIDENGTKETKEETAKSIELFSRFLQEDRQKEAVSIESIKQVLQNTKATKIPDEISIDTFLESLENFTNKENFIQHLQSKNDAQARLAFLNLVEPTFKQPDFHFKKIENGIQKDKRIKKFTNGKDFYYLLVTKDKDTTLLTGFKTNKINSIAKEFEGLDADIIQTFIQQGSKQDKQGLGYQSNVTDSTPPTIKDNLENRDVSTSFQHDNVPTQEAPSAREGENSNAPSVAPPKHTIATNDVVPTDYAVDIEIATELAARDKKQRLVDNLEALRTLGELARGERLNAARQQSLARYSGFGGLMVRDVEGLRQLLLPIAENDAFVQHALLGKNLYDAHHRADILYSQIAANADNSYYTPHAIISAIWEHLGFVKGRVLEPSMGIGNFFVAMPRDIFGRVQKVGIEIDPIAAAIGKQLSPNVDVQAKSFYDFKSDVGFDLVIGNPPYGEHLKDFILKSVDSAKENGIIVQVVSSTFLDNAASRDVRAAIADKAELLGAVRLPSKTFSGTDIATDIVVFQKRIHRKNSTYWRGAKTYKEDSELTLNNYYHENPEHILGELVVGSTQYGQRWIVKQGEDIEDALHEKLGAILAKRENESDCIIARQNDVQEAVASGFTPHTFFLLNDTIMQAQKNAEPIPVDFLQSVRGNGAPFETLNKSAQTRRTNEAKKAESMARDYLALRDSLLAMRSSEARETTSAESLQSLRQTLNDNYDSFVKKFGKVSENTLLKKVFAEDPSFSSVADLDARGRHQILDSRVIFPYQIPTKAKDIQDAIAISKGYAGKISEDYINELLGDRYAVQKALASGELFADAKGNLFTKDAFVVGDLGARIDAFKELKELNPQQKKALETLEAALPEPLEIHEIYYHPSSNFIPKEAMIGFFDSLGVKATYYKPTNRFIIDHKSGSHQFQTAYSATTDNMAHSATVVLESLLNNKPLRFSKQINGVKQSYPEQFAANKMAQDKLLDCFYAYMQKHYAKDIADSYNHTFRRIVANDFQDEPILYGANPDINLHPHQKSAVAFAIAEPNVLLDHSVGAGKTFEMIAIASEWKRLGISKNPLFVVPNHLVQQWAKSFTQLYPASRVLTIPTNDAGRKRALAMLANGGNDFDAVIMPHSTFDSIHLSNEKSAQYVYEEIQELEQFEKEIRRQRSKDPLTKREQERLEKSIAKKKIALQQKYDKLLDTKAPKEDSITFEELGFDSLFVDEAHAYKNLGFLSANRNIRGMGNSVGSQKALNLLHKVRSMQEHEQRIVFATGTPLVNSVSEVYTWQRFLAPQFLKDNKIASFDSWVNLFGQVSSELERTPVGTYKDIMRLRSFKNTSELSTLYRQFAHYVDVSQTHIKRPQVEQVSIQCQSSPQQKDYMQHLLKRYEALSKDETIEGFENDNFLNITTDGINAALDYRIIDKAAEDFSESKINRATSEMLKLYKESNKDLGTQLVFIDRSTPKPKRGIRDEIRNVFEEYYHAKDEKTEEALAQKLEEMAKKHHYDNIDEMRNAVYGDFSVYEDMRDKLIKAGIPKEQIAFIHDYTTDAQKAKLFADVNAGKIRFLFGSTKKMGAGMNVQERIVGLHHIDAAWNPADMEQRNGRAIRQGNLLAEKYADFKIKIFSYVTENSCDAVYYSKLEQKATSIKNFRSGHAQKDDLSDDVILTLEELKALATGDTRELEKASLNKELQNVQYQLNALKSADAFQEIERQNCTKDIKILPQEITNLKDDLDIAKQRKIRKLSEDEKESLRNLEIVPDNKEPLFRLDNYDVFLEKSPRGIYTLSAISDNGNEIVLLKQSEPPKNLAHYAQKLIEQSSAASIEARIAQREEELKSAHAKLKSIEQSTTGKEIATLEAKEKELSGKIAKLIKEMSAQPNNATKEESAKATTNLTAYQQQLLQRELAEFNAKFKEDSTVNPQQIDITDLESLATFFNGWRSVKDPIRAEDLLNGEFLKEMMFQTNNKEFAYLLKNLEAISLSVDPKKDEYGIWKAFKAIQSDTDRAHITKERKLDKKKDPTRYAKEQERCRENLQENRERIEKALDIKPIQEFGTNYAEFYHDGVGAIKKLIAESKDYQSRKKAKELTKEEQENNVFRGQVAGAFYRKELGDITLAWGEEGTGKSDGYGLAKIAKFHPEVLDKLDKIITSLPIIKKTNNRFQLEDEHYKIGIRRDFEGVKQNWVLTAFEKKDSIARRRTDLPSAETEAGKATPANADTNSTPQNIKNSLENGETHASLHEQLKKLERELAANTERIDKAMPEDKPKLREIHRELLDKKKQIKAELGDTANATRDTTTLVQRIQDTFNFSPQKAKDLAHWHKESHSITKDEQGLPKVFYRLVRENSFIGRKVEFDVFSRQTSMKDIPNDIQDSAYGIAFYTNREDIKLAHRNRSKLYEVFLNIKKPLDLDTIITKENMAELEQLFKRNNEPKHLRTNIAEFENKPLIDYLIQKGFDQYPYSLMRKNEKGIHGQLNFNNLADFLSLKGYDSATKTIVGEGKIIYVFNPNQIKSIENRGNFNSSNNIYQSNLHIGSGTLTGSIAGIETDEQGNISFSPEKFVLGFLAGAAGSKAISSALQHLSKNKEHKKQAIDIIAQSLAQNVPDTLKKYPLLELVLPRKMSTSAQGLQAQTQTMISKLEQKEQRGLFNVVYNGKNATKIYKDLERIDEAIVLEKGTKKKGAAHIRIKHSTELSQEGYVTPLEIMNLGKDVRAFLKKHNEPFIDNNKARIYEWENNEKVRFRLVVNDTSSGNSNLPSASGDIITFYSDRNLKNPMQFKNPALRGAK